MEGLQQFFKTAPVDAQGVAGALWMIVALPLLGSVVCGLLGRWLGRANVHLVACSAVLGSFLLSLLAFWVVADPAILIQSPFGVGAARYTLGMDHGVWFSAGAFTARFGLTVDHLSGTMLLVVTGVGFLIHVYSTEYMSHDPGYARYFAYLNLFVAMMLTLVLADNLVLTFVGWEGVGLCSYLLIGFWYTDPAKAWAGRKAFIANRVGDFAFIIGACVLSLWVWSFSVQGKESNLGQPAQAEAYLGGLKERGPLSYQGLEATARRLVDPPPGAQNAPKVSLGTEIAEGPLRGRTYGGVLTVVLLLFLLGAAGKSAQLPLYVWLPDAMAGPTPVSALIHAATMVTAGVYLFARLGTLLVLSPLAMSAVALVGAATAILAAVIAFAQDDIKKVLAYSTVSQLGFMFMGVGMGVFWAAILHLVTHAFFKACLFLGAGSVMHGNGGETDIKKLGGLRRQMPWTWATFAVATAAITGVVPLSGFFSKDAILHGIHGTDLLQYPWVPRVVWSVGLAAAFCTAFYMARLYLLTFEGRRSPEAKLPAAHESGKAITVPLLLLAAFSVVALVHALPLIEGTDEAVMQNFLSPVFAQARRLGGQRLAGTLGAPHEGGLWAAWVLALAIAWAGSGLAVWFYRVALPGGKVPALPGWARRVQSVVRHKFYVDELYDLVLIRPLKFGSFVLYRVVDSLLIDRVVVRGTAWVTYQTGSVIRYFQTGDAQSYATVMALAVLAAVAYAFFNFR